MTLSFRATFLGAAAGFVAFGAQAADLPRRAPPPPLPLPPVFTWTGFYAGLNAGYAFHTNSGGFTDPTYGAVTGGNRSGGFAGGGQIGYNYQFTPGSGFVIGFETDIQGTAFAKADAAYLGATPYYSVRPSLDYFGTVRGRLGYAFDRVLIYGTGGFAYGGGSRASNAASYPYTLPGTDRTGYAAGGGVEYAFTEKLSAKVEALYVQLGRGFAGTTYYNAGVPAYYGAGKQDSGFALVRAGVNYRF
ncbi:outer membrane immunogenic protein [Methylobacterium phyllostachyos]|uniref:Outer membrane immunogenic protein n=1 Tax=Methylobacterium phyllostachyos TaxID=582672 RepID=A0A1H0CMR2_9HYPH|nr:outer membrane beta-barrel protein [Methylobacterium phyllostachyos]SDN59135.1 outer membrane immunogenic protein [Methylobacterium phyllostachyos]